MPLRSDLSMSRLGVISSFHRFRFSVAEGSECIALTNKHCESFNQHRAMNGQKSAAWKVKTQNGLDGLVLEDSIASPDDLSDYDCLIAIEASSLNYRDITIATVSFLGRSL